MNSKSLSASDLRVKDLSISTGDGLSIISHLSFNIQQGERILLSGESGCGKSTILRVLAGLWPWKTGEVTTPSIAHSALLPQKPYFPTGTLAMALSYPKDSQS